MLEMLQNMLQEIIMTKDMMMSLDLYWVKDLQHQIYQIN